MLTDLGPPLMRWLAHKAFDFGFWLTDWLALWEDDAPEADV